ncbi:MAG: NAD(P)/FAD-dependent oxidoreductase [Methanomassiliicoccales archaeon]|nr:NAD(P)/FAD-dependent oxidoreductase [Methanomassiliicoccales archaeon]MDD1756812.1 NAD(P)/FAD-dependent oxidoreductase [Methanomassiliicoccales archaeon]
MDYDVVIVGCGPAGLQAAIHAARKKVTVAVIGRPEGSGLNRAEVENYFGIDSMGGKELLAKGMEQAKRFGAEIFEQDVMKLERKDDSFIVITDHDMEFKSKALVLAPGISRKKLNAPGEKELLGKGVSYCASCDCNFFKGRTVAVVGDESTAASAALLLTEYASAVYWISKNLNVSPMLMAKVKATKVEIVSPASVARITGEERVKGLELNDGRRFSLDGVFIELGAKGSANLALDLDVIPDPTGTIEVNAGMETGVRGLFACGDVTGQPWQLARAVGQGCIAGTNAAKFVRTEAE